MDPERFISVVIPNFNGASTIERSLEAAFASRHKNFEVVVVDDGSDDESIEIIRKYPCRLIELDGHHGTSKARNTGAFNSKGDYVFFIDADCLLKEDTLSIVNNTINSADDNVVIGGTYSCEPYDRGFFNKFQAVFVNYFETRWPDRPDYIAAHAMIINREAFIKSGGFPERFMPIIEDVAFSHRLKGQGYRLIMNPEIEVKHIFNFNLLKSMKNAIRKTMYWSMYSLRSRDALKDSGTASRELKVSVTAIFLNFVFFLLWLFIHKSLFLYALVILQLLNISINAGLFRAFYRSGGLKFCLLASLYYITLYSLSVGIGSIMGVMGYILKAGRIY
jgi:glycosyltransferase involved in cell wall biosynthesis